MNVSTSKVKRAKRLALEKLEGSFLNDYNKLEAYGQELRTSNPRSDVFINISKEALLQGKRKFLRMYICFKALKDGWKSGLRSLIGLDVVDKETGRTWEWFLELLKCSLNLKDGHGVTFISNMPKEQLPCPYIELIRKVPCLTYDQKCSLIAPMTEQEIGDALRGMTKDKTPIIDGYPMEFFVKHWEIVKEDVAGDVMEFINTGKLHKEVSSTTITLVPKVTTPNKINDYRLIACCLTIYKLITKVLTNRIKLVIGTLVNPA
ncbi:hypothetical protein MTR67_034485 [Solanum verrucosum]|uniref:Uncharacterized protein n=1 Tax=Solanum verrucosum TaxID=315347 RepID=A0AAF0U8A6_SOLVR|nr:hypothetical protein MTR67_034485 [Solanum verrucosum]